MPERKQEKAKRRGVPRRPGGPCHSRLATAGGPTHESQTLRAVRAAAIRGGISCALRTPREPRTHWPAAKLARDLAALHGTVRSSKSSLAGTPPVPALPIALIATPVEPRMAFLPHWLVPAATSRVIPPHNHSIWEYEHTSLRGFAALLWQPVDPSVT